MKRLLTCLTCLLFSALAYAADGSQQNFPGAPIQFAGVPSGSCNVTQIAMNAATGDLYTCPNTGSVWAKATSTGTAVSGSSLTLQQPIVGGNGSTISASQATLYADKVPGYTSASDPCAAITTTQGNFTLPNEGVVEARGLIPVSGHNLTPCTVASANALLASCAAGYVQLGNYTLWVPLSEAVAATAFLPPQGTIPIPNKCGGLRGVGRGDQGGVNTTIAVCTGTNTPRTGCTAPQTREWSISSTAVSFAGGRTYLRINGTGMDLLPGEPVRIGGSSIKSNNGAWRACNFNLANSTRTDSNCPANPTSTTVYVVGVSGVTGVTWSGAGNAGYNTTCTISGGGGTLATCTDALTGGNVTQIIITNPGKGYTSAPTVTVGGGTGMTFTASIMAACAATCGTLHGEIPVIDTTPLSGNQFAQVLDNLSVDCMGVSGCVPYRSISGNEQTRVTNVKLSGSPERSIDIHAFNAQNPGKFEDLELYTGASGAASCDVGTTTFFISDNGPHELEDFTSNMSTCLHTPVSCGYVDTNVYPFEIHKGHCENAQKNVIFGQDAPAWGWVAQSWSGVSSTTQCADLTSAMGSVSTSGAGPSTVTWVSGNNQFTQYFVNTTITINSVGYTVTSVTDSTHLVVSGNTGTQTTVAYTDTLPVGNCVPNDGPYQNGTSAAIHISPNFVTGSQTTTDFAVINLVKGSAAVTNTLEDMADVSVTGTPNFSTDNIIAAYLVDLNASSGLTTILSSTSTIPSITAGLVTPVAIASAYCNSTFNAAAATYFLAGQGGGNVLSCTTAPTSAGLSIPLPVAGHIRKLSCASSVAGKDGTDAVMTVFDNGVATLLSCTIGTSTACTNDTSVAVAADHRLGLGAIVEATTTLSTPRCSFIITQ